MTTYHISIGYNPTRTDNDVMWEILKREAKRIAKSPSMIIAECKKYGLSVEQADRYASVYPLRLEEDGHPLEIREDVREIIQWASTDEGPKYHVRRAFCRLLIEAMHRHGIEVNLMVV